jgi:FMN phosphatase YigB (HAD superfamily)
MKVTSLKVISLDVWNTLIRANPEFSIQRNKYLAEELSLPIDTINSVYREVKDTGDNMAEKNGECISSMAIYKRFLLLLGRKYYSWLKLRRGLENVFAKYPPCVFPETIAALQRLQGQGIALSIASNTNFIRGEVLYNTVLNTWGIDWKFRVFSDQLLQAKPHPRFWNIVVKRAMTYVGAKPWEILHIGDNKVCDGACSVANIKFQHLEKPTELVHILERI